MSTSRRAGKALSVALAAVLLVPVIGLGQALAASRTSLWAVTVSPGSFSQTRSALDSIGVEVLAAWDVDPSPGFSVHLNDWQVAQVRTWPQVSKVAPDEEVSLQAVQDISYFGPGHGHWGLDRIDQRSYPLDNSFSYPDSAGEGVYIYVVDSGLSATQPGLEGRVLEGIDFVGDGNGTTDCNGHGTHVAGIAASTAYGVAKKAKIVPVRVFNCGGGGSFTAILAAVQWVGSMQRKGSPYAGHPAVMNLSLETAFDEALSAAFEGAVSSGVLPVIAAGNDNTGSCSASMGIPAAFAVGATNDTDTRAGFSNFGPCVALFAPGTFITSLAPGMPETAAAMMSGTSMATPMVSGVAALYRGLHPSATVAEVKSALLAGAHHMVKEAGPDTTDLLLSMDTLGIPSKPLNVAASQVTRTGAVVSWDAPDNTDVLPVSDYKVEYSGNGGSSWTTVSDGVSAVPAPATISGLSPYTSYTFRVSATGPGGAAGYPGTARATTLGEPVPSAPQQFAFTSVQAKSLTATWRAPATNADHVSRYVVEVATPWDEFAPLPDNSPDAMSATIDNTTPNTVYRLRVTAYNSQGEGTTSAVISAKTPPISTGVPVPSAPRDLSVTNISPTSAVVNWAAPESNASSVNGFTLEMATGSGEWAPALYFVPSQTFGDLLNLTPSTEYRLRLWAYNQDTLGSVSAEVSFRTPAAPTPTPTPTVTPTPTPSPAVTPTPKPTPRVLPGAPRYARVAAKSRTWVSLAWSAPAANKGGPVTDYVIRVSRDGRRWTTVRDGVSPTPGRRVSGLRHYVWYYFTISAVNKNGAGPRVTVRVRTL